MWRMPRPFASTSGSPVMEGHGVDYCTQVRGRSPDGGGDGVSNHNLAFELIFWKKL